MQERAMSTMACLEMSLLGHHDKVYKWTFVANDPLLITFLLASQLFLEQCGRNFTGCLQKWACIQNSIKGCNVYARLACTASREVSTYKVCITPVCCPSRVLRHRPANRSFHLHTTGHQLLQTGMLSCPKQESSPDSRMPTLVW